MRKKIKMLAAVLLCLPLVLTGCKEIENIPELLEPASEVKTFRPVEKRTLGEYCMELGDVEAEQYCHFYTKSMEIAKINCVLGQFVHEGDVLVEGNTKYTERQIQSLQNEYDKMVQTHDYDEKIYEYNLKNMQLTRELTAYLEGEDAAKDVDTQIKFMEDDHVLDVELYEYTIQSLQNDMAELRKLVSESNLVAKKSGYVTYVKNLTSSSANLAMADENVVVVSDYDDLYIHVDCITRDYRYTDYAVKYTYIDGKKVYITEKEYSPKTIITGKAKNTYPDVKLVPEGDVKLTLGETLVLSFFHLDKEDVLVIGKDSSDSDADGTFVYVKGADGNVEKRYYEGGFTDDNYIEVVSGLSEGEEVLYEQETTVPVKYETCEATIGEYIHTEEIHNAKIAKSGGKKYQTTVSGTVEEVLADVGDEVHTGDVLMTIRVATGKGAMTEADNTVTHLEEDYNEEKKNRTKKVDDLVLLKDSDNGNADILEAQLKALKKPEEGSTPDKIASYNAKKVALESQINTLRINAQTNINQIEICYLEQQKSDVEYSYDMKEAKNQQSYQREANNGTGLIQIKATEDGIVDSVHVSVGNYVSPSETERNLLTTVSMFENYATFAFNEHMPMPVGYKFTVEDEDNNKYSCECVSTNDMDRVYATSEGEDVTLTVGSATQNGRDVVKVDNPEFFTLMLSDFGGSIEEWKIDNLVFVPGSYVYTEETFMHDIYNYVWKLENGVPVKQYVIKGTEGGIGDDNNTVILFGVSEGDVLVKGLKN